MRFFLIVAFMYCVCLFKWSMDLYAFYLLKKNNKHFPSISFMEKLKFTYLHAKGNNDLYCKYFHPLAKNNRMFFKVYRCWLRFESILILAVFFSFLGAMLIIPLIALLLKYMQREVFSKHAGYVEIGFSENTITKKSIYQEICKNASMMQPGVL